MVKFKLKASMVSLYVIFSAGSGRVGLDLGIRLGQVIRYWLGLFSLSLLAYPSLCFQACPLKFVMLLLLFSKFHIFEGSPVVMVININAFFLY